jgi:tetratricopeptide (TPR) repeat protein
MSLTQDVDLFQVLVDVLAEAYARERMSSVAHIVSASSFDDGKGKGEGELFQGIINLLRIEREHQISEKWEDYRVNEFILLCVLKVETDENRTLRRWYDNLFSQITVGLIKRELFKSQQEFDSRNLFHIEPGIMILLIPSYRTRDGFENLQRKLRDDVLRISNSLQNVEVSIWLVYFPYSSLIKEMKEKNLVEPYELDQIAQKLIINTTKATFKIARLLMNAEHQINQGEYGNAKMALLMAESRTDIQEGLPFIYRRLSDTFGGLGDWEPAKEYALKAVNLEKEEGRPYSGSYHRLAKAEERLKNPTGALENYKEAAKLSNEPEYQISFARALILYGDTDDQYREAERILNILVSLTEIPESLRAYATFLRMQAERKLNRDKLQRKNTYGLVLDLDKNNSILSWGRDDFGFTEN